MIYFAHAGPPVDLIKVGFSAAPKQRIESLNSWCPVPLKTIGVVEGGRTAEGYVLWKLAAHKARGEWFFAHPEAWRLINEIVAAGSVPDMFGGWNRREARLAAGDIPDLLSLCGASVADLCQHLGIRPRDRLAWGRMVPPRHAQPVMEFFAARAEMLEAFHLPPLNSEAA